MNPTKVIGIPDVLYKYYPNAVWRFEGNDDLNYKGLVWECDDIRPTKEELFEKIELLKKEIENTQYQRDRAKEYPSIQDQLDILYHGGYEVWKSEIEKIKEKYPKPEES